jgi:hypothetical protein
MWTGLLWLALNRNMRLALVNMVMNLHLPQHEQKFSTNWKTELSKKESGLNEWSYLVCLFVCLSVSQLPMGISSTSSNSDPNYNHGPISDVTCMLYLYLRPWRLQSTEWLTDSRYSRFHRGEDAKSAAVWSSMIRHDNMNFTLLTMSISLDSCLFRFLMFCLAEKQNNRSRPNIPAITHKHNVTVSMTTNFKGKGKGRVHPAKGHRGPRWKQR